MDVIPAPPGRFLPSLTKILPVFPRSHYSVRGALQAGTGHPVSIWLRRSPAKALLCPACPPWPRRQNHDEYRPGTSRSAAWPLPFSTRPEHLSRTPRYPIQPEEFILLDAGPRVFKEQFPVVPGGSESLQSNKRNSGPLPPRAPDSFSHRDRERACSILGNTPGSTS